VGLAYFFAELVDKLLPEKQENDNIYQLLKETLDQVISVKNETQGRLYATNFANKLLELLGYLPPTRRISFFEIQPFVERIIERKLQTVSLLTKMKLYD
jgi:hypothetical protein